MNEELFKHILNNSDNLFRYISDILPDPDEIFKSKGYNYDFFRNLLKDPFFDGVWEKRVCNIVRNNFYFVNPDGTKENEETIEYLKNYLNRENLHSLFGGFLESVLFGFSVSEIIWQLESFNNKNIFGVKEIVKKPQEWISFDKDNNPVKKRDSKKLEEYKFLIARHFAEYTNPYGKKLASILFWLLVFKKGGWRFWTIFLEKFGGASAFSNIPENKYEDESFKESILESLDKLCGGGVGVFPEGVETQIIESKNKEGSGSLFKDYINTIDKNISICVLGETLSTMQQETGAKAATQVHNEIRKEKTDVDMSIIEPIVNKLIEYFAILNYGKSNNLPYFLFQRETNEKLIDRDSKLRQTYNIKFNKQYVIDNFDIDEKYLDDDYVSGENNFSLQNNSKKFEKKIEKINKDEKRILRDNELINEFAGKMTGKFQKGVDKIIDELIDSLDSVTDLTDENKVFKAIIEKYKDLDFSEIVEIIDNVRYAASQIGCASESKKKTTGLFQRLLTSLESIFQKKKR